MANELEDLEQRVIRVERFLNLPPLNQVKPVEQNRVAEPDVVPAMPKRDLETDIGRKLLPIAGILAVIFGVSYFFKYAFEVGLITIVWRVIIGLVAGAILLGLGEWLRSKYPKYAWILSGGGGAIWYISLYAAFNLYHLISQPAAFAAMIIVTIALSLLALHHQAQPLMAIAVLGGFLTPAIVRVGIDNQVTLFTYIALLNAGILLASLVRSWQWVYVVGFIGTGITVLAWFLQYYAPDRLVTTEIFVSIYFVEFLFSSLAHLIPSRQSIKREDVLFLVLNVAAFYGFSYVLLSDRYYNYLGLFTLILSAMYLVIGYISVSIKSADQLLAQTFGGITIALGTLVFPVQFDNNVVAIAWSAEAVLLIWFGFMVKQKMARLAGIICLLFAICHLWMFDSRWSVEAFTLFVNKRFGTYVLVIGAGILLNWVYARKARTAELESDEHDLVYVLGGTWMVLLLGALSLEIGTYFKMQVSLLDANTLQHSSDMVVKKLINQRNAALSILWAVYATALLLIGMFKKIKAIRWGALLLFGITVLKVFIIDLSSLQTLYRFISTIIIGILLLVGSYWYYRNQVKLQS